MKFFSGVTDNKWFEFLSALQPDEVNFWQPSPTAPTKALKPGAPFLFKLKSPNHHIAGGGYFVKFVTAPLSLVWESYEAKNGANSLYELQTLLLPLIAKRGNHSRDPEIGCTVLTHPFFFQRSDWIEADRYFPKNIVRGKGFDSNSSDGAALWSAVRSRLLARTSLRNRRDIADQDIAYGAERLFQPRLGQSSFRLLVTDAYKRRCSITGEHTLPVLEAAHIKPFSQSRSHEISNGLLLRSDFHKLFDRGYLTVNTDNV